MGRANSPSGRRECKTRKLWCPSLTAEWGCPHSRRNRSSMLSLLPSRTEPAWDFESIEDLFRLLWGQPHSAVSDGHHNFLVLHTTRLDGEFARPIRRECKTRKLWCPSLTAEWGCPHSRRNRSSMLS